MAFNKNKVRRRPASRHRRLRVEPLEQRTLLATLFSDTFSPQQLGWTVTSPSGGFLGELNVSSVSLLVTAPNVDAAATLEFDLLGFRSIDGTNCCTDTLTLRINGAIAFSGTWTYDDTFSTFFANPSDATFQPAIVGGYGASSVAHRIVVPHELLKGTNAYTWSYSGLSDFADEAWGLDNVLVNWSPDILVGVVTHGLALSGYAPDWLSQMEASLPGQGYDIVIPFDWADTSRLPVPGVIDNESARLASVIKNQLEEAGTSGPFDIHLIGHSRGAGVVSKAAAKIDSFDLDVRSIKLTLLDPHPAHNHFPPFFSTSLDAPLSALGWFTSTAVVSFQSKARDPEITVAANVNEVEVFFQNTPSEVLPNYHVEKYLNLWGELPAQFDTSVDLTAQAITHLEVPYWYLANVVPRLNFAGGDTSFFAGGVGLIDGNVEGEATSQPSDLDLVYPALVTDINVAQQLLDLIRSAREAFDSGDIEECAFRLRNVVAYVHSQSATIFTPGVFEFFSGTASVLAQSVLEGPIADFGDAPDSYQTVLPSNGPSHVANGPTLGLVRDSENDGVPSFAADGDELQGSDDEDGVTFVTPLLSSTAVAQISSVVVSASAPAKLDAWIDFNGNGTFEDPGERITAATGALLAAGDSMLSFNVPVGARVGDTFARFRLSTGGGLLPSGPAADGEVEDYSVAIRAALVVTNTANNGPGSLRQAIMDAGSTARPDWIAFNIPATDPNFVDVDSSLPGGDAAPDVWVIRPLTALPFIADTTNAMTIAGQTQTTFGGDINPFGPEVVLDGSLAGAGVSGLRISSNRNQVFGLNIQQFSANGISIFDGQENWLAGNYIGTDATGTLDRGNGGNGVQISSAASNNTVGGTRAADRNVISGNNSNGVLIPAVAASTNNNVIQGNYVGLNAGGTAAIGNSAAGVLIAFGTGNVVDGNVISGNANGVVLSSSAAVGNVVQGNLIGTNAGGTAAVPNNSDGVLIQSGSASNRIGTDGDGVNDSAERNVISGNTLRGVRIIGAGTTGNIVAGNYIGTDINGVAAVANLSSGVIVDSGAALNRIGTNGDGVNDVKLIGGLLEGNLVSGNVGTGILIQNVGSDGNVVAGNYIGTDKSGSTFVRNTGQGVQIQGGAKANRIGTDGSPDAFNVNERNLVSGNGGHGVVIQNAGSENNVVAGNFIGTNAGGTAALGNLNNGVLIQLGAKLNRIGTDGSNDAFNAVERNVISGNSGRGVRLQDAGTTGNVVAGNYLGTNAAGTGAVGNVTDGVIIVGAASGNIIGTNGDGLNDAAERNVISGNLQRGVRIDGAGTSGNIVAGNYIGTDSAGGGALGNLLEGVSIRVSATANIIGTNGDGINDAVEGNTIAFNTGTGVAVTDAGTTGNRILRNAIYSNGGLGIDLGAVGATANDAGDADTGPNNVQNFPVLTSAVVIGGNFTISGFARPGNQIELFIASGEASGFGEGLTYLGTFTEGSAADGDATSGSYNIPGVGGDTTNRFQLTIPMPAGVTSATLLTATATDASNNTSEFGFNIGVVVVNQPPTAAAGGPYPTVEGQSVVLDGTGSSDPDQDGQTLIYSWDLDGDGVFGETGTDAGRGDEVGQTPTFSAAGLDGPAEVIVTLRVTDSGGLSAEDSTSIVISNADPTIHNVLNDGPVNEGVSVTVTVIADDAAGGSDSLSYEFDFNNDGVYEVSPQASNSAAYTYFDNGAYGVNVRVSDGDGGVVVGSLMVIVSNANPTIRSVSNNGPVDEGNSVTVTVASDDPAGANDPLRYEFDFNNDGVYEVGPQASPSASHTYVDNGQYEVQVRVTDGDEGVVLGSAIVNVINANPTIRGVFNNGPVDQGGSVTVTVTADDAAGANDPLRYEFDFNNDGVYEVGPQVGVSAPHIYAANGTYVVNVRVSDGDGGVDEGSTVVTVNSIFAGSVSIVPDGSTGKTALLVTGTEKNDVILVTPGLRSSTLIVSLNWQIHVVPKPTGRIIVQGGAGNDGISLVSLFGLVNNQAWLYGDEGNDVLDAGRGGSLMFGGPGNDWLNGGSGRDVLIGGEGADLLSGNGGDDILVAGYTLKDTRGAAGHDVFWRAVLSEWNSGNAFEKRVKNLRNGSGGNAINNGSYLLPQVKDDIQPGAVDLIIGGNDKDWLLYKVGEDKLTGAAEATN